jgi:hypothetical protein
MKTHLTFPRPSCPVAPQVPARRIVLVPRQMEIFSATVLNYFLQGGGPLGTRGSCLVTNILPSSPKVALCYGRMKLPPGSR